MLTASRTRQVFGGHGNHIPKAFIKDELKSCHICVLVALAAVIVTTSFSKGLEFCILFGILRLQGLALRFDPSLHWDPPGGDSATPRRSGGWASQVESEPLLFTLGLE